MAYCNNYCMVFNVKPMKINLLSSIVGSYSSTKSGKRDEVSYHANYKITSTAECRSYYLRFWINWIVRADLPTPPPPTITSLYSVIVYFICVELLELEQIGTMKKPFYLLLLVEWHAWHFGLFLMDQSRTASLLLMDQSCSFIYFYWRTIYIFTYI